AAYERRFRGQPEGDILRLMGLFDRPAEKDALEVLRREPAIPGVTGRIAGLTGQKWNRAVSHLVELNLLSKEKEAGSGHLDCHPLVREHFAAVLEAEAPKGKKEAHLRLYGWYKEKPKKELPDTLEDMLPLFAAVAHGCMAGIHQEVMDEVYYKRIRREGGNYCCNQLGAFGADLSALWYFFQQPWSQPAEGLREGDKAAVLSWAAFRLRALGRLREAGPPMEAGLDLNLKQEDWKNASANAGNLSELMLTLGEVSRAMGYGEAAVAHADKSEDEFWQEASRTTLADALHQAGRFRAAGQRFREAEAMQRKTQPQFQFLYALAGYFFCDLLLSDADTPEDVARVVKRAEQTLEWGNQYGNLLDIALNHLTLGRARMQAADPALPPLPLLDRAVEGLRKSGYQYYLPLGLLARAACFRLSGQWDAAQTDLNEAREISEMGDMKLHLIDYHLESARLCQARKKEEEKQEHVATAAKMIEETGYHRRDRELGKLKDK
ncbi:MAG: hypothetical protein GY940_46140, partial [bacterium]|nr:hypothetical protein [bacterium]